MTMVEFMVEYIRMVEAGHGTPEDVAHVAAFRAALAALPADR